MQGGNFNSKHIEINSKMIDLKKYVDDHFFGVIAEEKLQEEYEITQQILEDENNGIYSNVQDIKRRKKLLKCYLALLEFYMPVDAVVCSIITKKIEYIIMAITIGVVTFFIYFIFCLYVKHNTNIVKINPSESNKGEAKKGKKTYNLNELRFKTDKCNFGKDKVLKAYKERCGIKMCVFKLKSYHLDEEFDELVGKLNRLRLID